MILQPAAVHTAGSLAEAAVRVLLTADPLAKAVLSQCIASAWRRRELSCIGVAVTPDRPARPARPELRPPREMPNRRRAGSVSGRIAMLHAVAHIELNAIDLAWDMVARFAGDGLPETFFDDWVGVADDEARHFQSVSARLADFDADYGALPAHDGLWQASQATACDLAARLAVVPMVLEARGLDVTPAMIVSLRAAGDHASALVLEEILEDEIGHVAAGCRWFRYVCDGRGWLPVAAWQDLVCRFFNGDLKAPFNHEARRRAGFGPEYYEPLTIPEQGTAAPAEPRR